MKRPSGWALAPMWETWKKLWSLASDQFSSGHCGNLGSETALPLSVTLIFQINKINLLKKMSEPVEPVDGRYFFLSLSLSLPFK